jgi:WD40 repeat protein
MLFCVGVFAQPELKDIINTGTVPVSSCEFTADNTALACAILDGTLQIRDLKSKELLYTIIHSTPPDGIECLALSRDGRYAATGGRDGKLKLWDIHNGSLLKSFENFNGIVSSCAFSRGSEMLAAGTVEKFFIFRLSDQATIAEIKTSGYVKRLIFTPDNDFLITASSDRAIKWDIHGKNLINDLLKIDRLEIKKEREYIHGSALQAAALSADTQYLATAADDGYVKMWRLNDGLPIWSVKAHEGTIWDLRFSPSGRVIFSAGADTMINARASDTGAFLYFIAGGPEEVNSIDFNSSGSLFASASRDGKVRLWHITEGGEINAAVKRTILWLAAVAGFGLIALMSLLIINRNKKKPEGKV